MIIQEGYYKNRNKDVVHVTNIYSFYNTNKRFRVEYLSTGKVYSVNGLGDANDRSVFHSQLDLVEYLNPDECPEYYL
jgi:alpha-mannosidase